MCKWDVPLTQRCRRILVITEPDNVRHFLLQFAPVERLPGLNVLYHSTRRVVNWVTAENKQLFDPTVVYFCRELREIDRSRVARNLTHHKCLTDIFQRSIDPVNE